MRNLRRLLALSVALVGLGAQACSEDHADKPEFVPPGAGGEPEGLVVTPPTLPPGVPSSSAPIAKGSRAGAPVVLPSGSEVHTIVVDGKTYVPIEATFSEKSWQAIIGKAGFEGLDRAARDKAVIAELEEVVRKVSPHARIVGAEYDARVGLLTGYIPADAYASLSGIRGIGRRLLVNPITSTPMERAERDIKVDKELGFAAASGAFGGLEGLVGLVPMQVNEFLDAASADLDGYRPNGSHVTLGVVDTGLTYNHPAFTDVDGKSRIDSMRDFTGEGRIFFLPNARFEAKAGEGAGEMTISADFLASPKTVAETPDPAALEKIDNEKILVPNDLKALLSAPNASGAKFGVLDENCFGSGANGIDLDHNGKTDDRFYAILVPGQNGEPDAVWLSLAGKGDFRKSPRLTSFDLAHETMPIYAEKVGLDIKKEALVDAAGAEVPVTTASIVGFDPGNHGSHVMGIAAARKIFANSPDDTNLRGVAPLARLVSGRICAKTGGCRGTKAIAELSARGANVINMSIGGLGPDNDGYGVQEAIIDRLTVQNGTVFVIAASNDGPGKQTVGSPAVARYGIAVAATATRKIIEAQYHWPGSGKVPSADAASEDFLMNFSSRGPSSAGGMKPDIAAPGTWLSAIQLNGAPGDVSGLDVMWGTSMASPAAAGAVTLLLDAAKAFNEKHPTTPLATDAVTIRRVVLGSARPFDLTSFDPKTGETSKGQYTWIDQGFGMINLPKAWQMLKAERKGRQAAAVAFVEEGKKHAVDLDYQVRVLRKNPNGLAYDGSQVVQGLGDTPEAKFGRGLWLDTRATESLYRVQVARRLPSSVLDRPDIGDLAMQLKTTADEFELETTIHGSHLNWVRLGAVNGLDCNANPPATATPPRVLIIGEGANDQPINPATGAGGSVAQTTSVIHVCVNRALVDQLPPGDHGALVTAYRVIGNKREAVPSFHVPVYLTVPHKTMAGPTGLHVESTVSSFGVGRHYIDVPKDTSIVRVNLEVPPASQTGTDVTGCAGILLEALEGGNTATPPEFVKAPADAVAQNCSSQGKVAPDDWRRVTLSRSKPTAGIWDLHVFGLYNYTQSPYSLDVQFAKVTSTKLVIEGNAAALNNTFDVDVVDASYPLVVSTQNSAFALNGYFQEGQQQVAEGATLPVPNAAGKVARAYGADVATVTFATSLSAGNDLDLDVLECSDEAATACARAGSSGGPADTETVTITPKPGKFYVAAVIGFAIKAGEGRFVFRESQAVKAPEKGTLTMTTPQPKKFSFATAFNTASSAILGDARFTGGTYVVEGGIDIKDEQGTVIVRVPVRVKQQ